jgi:hypothetical protein
VSASSPRFTRALTPPSLRSDATYIIINIFFVAQPTSYWAILVPLALATGLLKDAFTRTALDNATFVVLMEAAEQKFDEAKASGTLPEKLCTDFLTRLNSGKRGRIEVNPPAGYPMMKPRMWYEDSEDTKVATVLLEFIVPGVTPGQAFTFLWRYSSEERGIGTLQTLQVRTLLFGIRNTFATLTLFLVIIRSSPRITVRTTQNWLAQPSTQLFRGVTSPATMSGRSSFARTARWTSSA